MALRLSPLLVLALALAASSSVGATTAPKVPVKVAITGVGTVSIGTVRIGCRHPSCSQTLLMRKGAKVVVRGQGQVGSMLSWGAGCKGTAASCTLLLSKPTRIAVTFTALGAKTNPIPMGSTRYIDADPGGIGWSLKVVSVTPDATSQVLAVANNATCCTPRLGAQDFLVVISATANGSPLDLSPLIANLYARGDSYYNGIYSVSNSSCGTLPAPNLFDQATFNSVVGDFIVPAGSTITGNLCFKIDADDATSLRLFTEPPLMNQDPPDIPAAPDKYAVWFALH